MHYQRGNLVESRPCWQVVPLPGPALPYTSPDEHYTSPDEHESDFESLCQFSLSRFPRFVLHADLSRTSACAHDFSNYTTTQLHNDNLNNMLSEEVHVLLEEHLADANNSSLRYGLYQILAVDNVSRSISATLGELNTISCPGREYHNGLLQISRNAIDADADRYNNNLNNTLHEDVNVSIKEFLADVNNSLQRAEVVSLICFFPSCGICFSLLQLILAHQNFACVRNPHCGRHCITAAARLYLCQRSRQGRRRLYTFSLSLLRQRQRLQETRTSPFLQPLPHGFHSQNTLSHTTPVSSSASSATPSTPVPTSQLGKQPGPANSHVGSNTKTAASSASCTSASGFNPRHPWYDPGEVVIYPRTVTVCLSVPRLLYLD